MCRKKQNQKRLKTKLEQNICSQEDSFTKNFVRFHHAMAYSVVDVYHPPSGSSTLKMEAARSSETLVHRLDSVASYVRVTWCFQLVAVSAGYVVRIGGG
jgi:hypothetical protein